MDIVNISPTFLAVVPVVIAISQFVKMNEYISSKYIPLFTVAVSILGCIALSNGQWIEAIVQGILVAFTAMGLFSGTRATVQN